MVVAHEYEGTVVEVSRCKSIMNMYNARVGEGFPALNSSNRFFIGQTEALCYVSQFLAAMSLCSSPSIRLKAKNLPLVADMAL